MKNDKTVYEEIPVLGLLEITEDVPVGYAASILGNSSYFGMSPFYTTESKEDSYKEEEPVLLKKLNIDGKYKL